MVDLQTEANLKADFLEWSGGFPPESPEQITVYIDYAIACGADPAAARDLPLAWMQEPSTGVQE